MLKITDEDCLRLTNIQQEQQNLINQRRSHTVQNKNSPLKVISSWDPSEILKSSSKKSNKVVEHNFVDDGIQGVELYQVEQMTK